MPLSGLAKRKARQEPPALSGRGSENEYRTFHTPPASRSSEPQHRNVDRTLILGDRLVQDHDPWDEQTCSRQLREFPQDMLEPQFYNGTFFSTDDERLRDNELESRRHSRGHHSMDDYGVAYSTYQAQFSPPRTPEDDSASLDWDSHFDPFTSSSFRKGSLVLDPAAFDSTPSVNYTPQSPGGSSIAGLSMKRSAEALRDFGKKVLPRLKIKSRDHSRMDHDTVYDPDRTHKSSPSTSSQPRTQSTPNRTRSNTVGSSRSTRSRGSVTHHSGTAQVADGGLSREFLDDASDVLSPLATYRSLHGSNAPIVQQSQLQALQEGKSISTPPPASPSTGSSKLSVVAERDPVFAPPISERPQRLLSPYNATDEELEEIMRLMQEEDRSFQATEESMIQSGWSSESEINDLKQRRQEQQNLWQRRLDDALDQVKAQNSLY